MHRLILLIPLTLLALAACYSADRATVVVVPHVTSVSDTFAAPPSGASSTLKTFESFARANGYTCHTTFKDRRKNVCRGPRDLHLTFQPRLGEAGYVAGFSWVRTQGRSTEEFHRLVQTFASSLEPDAKVEVSFGQFEP
jgi:hypothetical protein